MPRIPPCADFGVDVGVDFVSRFSAGAGIDVDVDSVSWFSAAAGIDVHVDFVALHLFLDHPFYEIHYCYQNLHWYPNMSHRRSHHRNHRLIRRLLQEQTDFQETRSLRRFQPLHDFRKKLTPDPQHPLHRVWNPMPVSRTRSLPLIRR